MSYRSHSDGALRASTDSYEMSMSVSDFQQFAANCAGLSAAAANSGPVFNGQQQQVTASIATQSRTPQQTLATVPPSSSLSLPQQGGFPSYPQPPQYPGQIQNPQAYPTASVATSSSSGMNFTAAAASGTPNNGMSIPNGGMSVADLSAFAAASHQQQAGASADMNGVPKQANNVFNLSNLSEMDVMKLFQKNAALQNGYEMDDKMSSMKDAMQPNLMNGIKRQMVMPTSMNAATLQSYQEQLASCLPPNAKRATLPTANPYGIPASSIAQMVANGQQQSAMMMAGGSTLSVTPQQQQAMPNMMQQNLLANAVSASASQFMMSNQLPHTVNSAAATMPSNSLAQNIMALQQMPAVSSYGNTGMGNVTMSLQGNQNGQNAAATMSSLQQQQQNWQLAAAFKQNQLKQAMLQQQQAAAAKMQQNMHPQAAAAMAAQAAARAQAIRESQILQQHQQRQSRTTTPAEGHKLSTTVIAQPQPVSENGLEVMHRLPSTPITSATLIQNGTKSSNFGPDDERFQAFLASIRSHVELQIAANRSAASSVAAKEIQTPPPVNVTLSQPIVSNGTADNQQTTLNAPEITDDTGRKSAKSVSRTQTPNCVDPVSI
ncbi:hypothetical protein Ddc_01819 [Ditylenchus destructor]|nr:hypothetical protein Ddc_01819 [Ditylenchus destructor]